MQRAAERLELAYTDIAGVRVRILPGHTYNSTNAKVPSSKARACARSFLQLSKLYISMSILNYFKKNAAGRLNFYLFCIYVRMLTCAEMTSKVGVAHKISRALTRAVYCIICNSTSLLSILDPPLYRGGSRGGLWVLKHPPKLPKVNYLLSIVIVVNCQLTL